MMGTRLQTLGLACHVGRELGKMPKEGGTGTGNLLAPGSFCSEQACAVCQEQAALTLLNLSPLFDTQSP